MLVLQIVAAVLVTELVGFWVAAALIHHLHKNRNKQAEEIISDQEVLNIAQAMLTNNVMIFFNDVQDPNVTESLLRALSIAYSKLSLGEKFYDPPLHIGYGFHKTHVSDEFQAELAGMEMRDANKS